MASAAFATRSQSAAPVARAEPVSARAKSSPDAQTSDFNRNLQSDRSETVNAIMKLNQKQEAAPVGNGLLSTGVQFLLAETRTQEAGAPLPPVSNLARARDQYLSTQAQVRDTIAANQVLRQGLTDASQGQTLGEGGQPGNGQYSEPDEDFDTEAETLRQSAALALGRSAAT